MDKTTELSSLPGLSHLTVPGVHLTAYLDNVPVILTHVADLAYLLKYYFVTRRRRLVSKMFHTTPNRCHLDFSMIIGYHDCLLKAEVNITNYVKGHPQDIQASKYTLFFISTSNSESRVAGA